MDMSELITQQVIRNRRAVAIEGSVFMIKLMIGGLEKNCSDAMPAMRDLLSALSKLERMRIVSIDAHLAARAELGPGGDAA